jgi:hypothetical protein
VARRHWSWIRGTAIADVVLAFNGFGERVSATVNPHEGRRQKDESCHQGG